MPPFDCTQEDQVLRDQLVAVASAVPGLIYSFRLSPDGVVTMPFASAGIDEIFGVPPEEVVRDFGTEAILHKDDLQRVRDSIHESARTLLPWRQEFRVLHPRKGVRWIEAHSIPKAEESGSILWHGYMQDVTERKLADEAMHYKTQLLYAQQEASTDGILVVNFDFSISSMNSRFVEMWRFPQELLDRRDHKALLEYGASQFADEERFRRVTRELYARPVARSQDEFALKDGRVIERRSFPFFGPDGACCGRMWTFRDVTEARRAEAALRESERFARSTLDSLAAHIAILDADGRILAVNAAWRKVAECNSSTTIGLVEGANYLTTCDAVEGPAGADAHAIAQGIRAVLAGTLERFSVEYPCHSETEERWFCARVTRFVGDGPLRLVVAHENITGRVVALNELRESKALLTEMGRVAKVGGWELNPATGMGSWTEETARIHGMKLNEATSPEAVLALYPPESRRVLSAAQTAAIAEGRPYDLELELDAADGSHKWIRIIAHPEVVDGSVIKLRGSFQDITDRKKVELALRESEALLTAMGRMAKVGGWEVDPIAGTRSWTEETARIHGLSVDLPMSGDLGLGCYAEASREALIKARAAAVEEGTPYDLELELESADGIRKWVRTIAYPEMQDGRVVKVRGSFQDITDRKKADQALRESEALLSTIFRVTPVAITIVRLSDGTSMMLNEGFTTLTGFTREEALGKTNGELGICVDHDLQNRMLQVIEEGKGPHIGNAQIRTKSGELKEILASIHPLTLNGERAAITVAADITEIKRAEAEMKSLQEQFLQAQKMEAIGQLAGGVAHDFNNLLQVINSYSERIADDYAHDPTLSFYGKSIHQAGQMAANLTRQMLAFSRNAPVRPRQVEVDTVLSGMVEMVRRLVGGHITVELDLKAPTGYAEVDPSQIEQIVLNLAVNSRDAMPKGGTLRLSTAPGGGAKDEAGVVLLVVSDTGEGMDAETQKRVFEPFFTTKPVGQGTGLGLSTVYGLVQQFGGRIEIESALGVGTRVTITIPLVEPAETKVEQKGVTTVAATAKAGAERILVVEDMANLRSLYEEGLRRFGYRVVTAEHGQEALALVEEAPEPFDLVISDAMMPVMGGVALFERLREIDPNAKLLLISGYTGDRLHEQETHAYGAVLAKPFSIGTFTRRVRQVLDGVAAEE